MTDYEFEGITVHGEPGTNFGVRIDAEEVVRLFREVLDPNKPRPFEVMAAGYGDDEDWSGLMAEDVMDTCEGDITQLEEMDWGPFELTVGPTREPTEADIEAANERGYYMDGGDFDAKSMTLDRAVKIVLSRLEAVMDVSPLVETAMARLASATLYEEEEGVPGGHQMGHNLCIWCLQYDMDPAEVCPDRADADAFDKADD